MINTALPKKDATLFLPLTTADDDDAE